MVRNSNNNEWMILVQFRFDESNDKEKALEAVLFSDGGIYYAGDLHTRAEMFDQMQSVIHSLHQNIDFFIQEVNMLMLKK